MPSLTKIQLRLLRNLADRATIFRYEGFYGAYFGVMGGEHRDPAPVSHFTIKALVRKGLIQGNMNGYGISDSGREEVQRNARRPE